MPPINNLPFLRPDTNAASVAVQNTTFSIDALGRFICNTWDEATAAVVHPSLLDASASFDAIVVGSGMYGAYCAEKIWRAGGKVLVLEAGPFLVSEHAQNLARIGLGNPDAVLPNSPEGRQTRNLVWGIPWSGNQIFVGQAFCVGGKSLFWGGWSPRLTADVLSRRPDPARQRPGFPPSAADYLAANYERTELQLGVREQKPGKPAAIETDFIDETGPNGLTAVLRRKIDDVVAGIPGLEKTERAPLAVQGNSPSSGLFSFDKYSSGPLLVDAIREDIDAAKGDDANRRLFLVPRCRVTRLETRDGMVQRVDVFVDGTFKSLTIPARTQVVLALGCVESTRLALESFPTPLMGRNLMVHLRSNLAIRIPRSKFAGLKTGVVETAATHVPGRTAAGGRFHLQVVAGANRDNSAEAIWFRSIPDADMLQGILLNQDADFVSLQLRACGEMLGIADTGSPNPAVSWIDLSPFERDEFGFRRAYVHLKLVPEDEQLWNDMDDAMFALAGQLGGGETEYFHQGQWKRTFPLEHRRKLNKEEGNGPRDALGTTYHESGTLWMGEDPASSVTNAQGRFHHVTNAWCVDQAIFPVVGSANPVPTGLTLARQAAEAIAALPSPGAAVAGGFVPLFKFSSNFQPLPDGWEHFGDGGFVRRGDILETEGGMGLLVYTAKKFSDFTLRLQWRAPRLDNNSGVYVRLPSPQGDFRTLIKRGYEVQIDNRGNRPGDASIFPEADFVPFHQTGAIYPVHEEDPLPEPNGMASLREIPTRPFGEWNDYEITAKGNRIRVLLNGVDVLEGGDYVDQAKGGQGAYPLGHVALQNHFKGFRVQFRNVQISEQANL